MSVYDNLVGMEEVLDEFIVETTELLEEVNEDLVRLESDPDPEIVNRIFRAFHTFKGTCGFLGFTQAKDLAHVAEDILNQLRNKKLKPTGGIIDSLLAASDWFSQFIEDVKEREENVYEIEPLINQLRTAQEGGDGQVAAAEAEAEPVASSEPEIADQETTAQAAMAEAVPENEQSVSGENGDSTEEIAAVSTDGDVAEDERALSTARLMELVDNIEKDLEEASNQVNDTNIGTLVGHFGALEDLCAELELSAMGGIAEKTHQYISALQRGQLNPSPEGNVIVVQVLGWFKGILMAAGNKPVEDEANTTLMADLMQLLSGSATDGKAAKVSPKEGKAGQVTQTIRVDMERLENLMNLAGELVLSRNQLAQAYTNLAAVKTADTAVDDLDQVNNSLGRITTEIQEAVMQMRMLPISNIFRKFPRVIRDLARDRKKEIELILEGEETELDRSVIEVISDPLLHLVRNAADHGIETPDIRQAKGKPAKGTVFLRAAHEGNHIVIEVEDDGGGIDADKLVAKALEKGTISPSEADALSYREKLNLIFLPGFSMAAEVTDVSGRGVGMDVVSTNIKKLNGVINIETKLGVGTCINIKLPLTLAIVTGLKVSVWDEEYIIPFSSIIETVILNESELTKVEDKWVIRFRDSVINTLYMDELFRVETTEKRADHQLYAVVVAVAEFRYALVVTGMVGQEEAVIKPLGQVLGRIPGIAGGTIGGDGRITLILDVPELIHHMGLG